MDLTGVTLNDWKVFNPSGKSRVLVTKMLPGREWLDILLQPGYRVEVNTSKEITSKTELIERIGNDCKTVIGQLTENWDINQFLGKQPPKGLLKVL